MESSERGRDDMIDRNKIIYAKSCVAWLICAGLLFVFCVTRSEIISFLLCSIYCIMWGPFLCFLYFMLKHDESFTPYKFAKIIVRDAKLVSWRVKIERRKQLSRRLQLIEMQIKEDTRRWEERFSYLCEHDNG